VTVDCQMHTISLASCWSQRQGHRCRIHFNEAVNIPWRLFVPLAVGK
jgi:hypothetical protein